MDRKKFTKKILSLFLASAMLIGIAPVNTFAETTKADWTIDEKKEEEMSYWKLVDKNEVTVVADAEGFKTPSINYIGTYINAQGRTVIRVSYRMFQNLASGVWQKALFKFDKDLYDLIDFGNSGTGMYKGAIDGGWHDSATYKDIVAFTNVVSSQSGAVNVKEQNLKNNGNKVGGSSRLEIPIDLVLKKDKTVGDIKGQPHIQMRITNDDYTQVFCVAGTEKSKNQNVIFTPYNSYTFMTYIPSANNNADVGTVSDYNVDKQFYSANSYAKYNEAGGYLDVFHKQSKLNSIDKIGGESFAFRQVFNENFAGVLKPQDGSGTVAEVFTANQQGEMWSTNRTIKITMSDLNTSDNSDLNQGFKGIQVASSFNNGTITNTGKFAGLKTVITTDKPQDSFLNSATTEFNSGLPTITRYYIDKDKVAAKGLTKDDLASFDFYSTFILDSQKKFIEYTATNNTGADIVLPANSKIGLTYADNPTSTPNTQLDKYSLTLGEGPYKIELRSNFTHVGGGPLQPGRGREYEYNLIPGMTIKAGEKITFRTMKYNTPPTKVTLTLPSTKGSKKIELLPGAKGAEVTTPRRLNYVTTYAGGSATQSGVNPDIDELFTDSQNITGRTRYNGAKIKLFYPNNKDYEFTIAEQAARTEMNVNGAEENGYTFTTEGKDGFTMPAGLVKDSVIGITNTDVKKASTPSEKVFEKVQAKVTFDLNGGNLDTTAKSFKGFDDTKLPGTEFAYKTERQSGNEEVVRIAPMNVKYNDNKEYKPNGFEGDNVSLKDHNGDVLTGDALELRKFVAEEPTVEGTVFLGWTTQKLSKTPQKVTEEFAKLTEAKTADEVNSDQNYIFTKTSPITKETTVYAAYGSPMVKFHTNPPAKLTDKTDEVINQSLTEQNITDRAIDLQKNHKDPKFQMEGYSLIGYSVNKDAKIPDENLTGTGITADKYLRDGDKMPLSKEQVANGLDLYAIWKPNYYVNVTKQWDPEELKAKNEDKIYVGLLTRPAVGVAGHEVVNDQALYRPVKGSVKPIKNAQNSTLSWTNLPSYDENGHRMSYITVELTEKTKQKFEAGITEYKEYGISVIEKEIEKDSGRFKIHAKTQLVNTDGVDAMSAATERKHYKSDGTSVDPHQVALGYFDTYGYDITLKNTEVKVQPPEIDPVEHDANKVVVKKVGDPNKLTITLPNGKKVILVKNGEGKLEKDQASTDFTGNIEITPEGVVTLTLPGEEKFKAEDVIQAFQTKKVGDADANSTITKTVVKEQPTSHKVVSYEQKPNDDKGNAVVEFTVPRHPLLPPKKGSEYTIGYMKGKEFVPVADKYVLNEDIISDNDTEKKAAFTIPQDNLKNIGDKKLIIKSDEKGKKPNYSDEVKVDTTAPTATAKAEDELWRRWVNLDLTGFKEESNVIVVSYTDAFGQEHKLRFDNEPDATGAVNMLERQGFQDYKVTLEDRFGNTNKVKPNYNPTTMTQVSLRKPRVGRKFVEVKVTDPNTHVTVRVYNKQYREQVMNNIYYYDKIKSADIIANASVVAQAKLQPGRGFSRIKFEDFKLQNGDVYKLQKGDIIEVIGSTDTGANNRTNPLVYVIK